MTLVRCNRMGRDGYLDDSDAEVHVEVDDGLNVYGHVNVNDGRQGQGLGRRRRGVPRAGSFPLRLREAGLMQVSTASPGARFWPPNPVFPASF
jgi:hypothetical protein